MNAVRLQRKPGVPSEEQVGPMRSEALPVGMREHARQDPDTPTLERLGGQAAGVALGKDGISRNQRVIGILILGAIALIIADAIAFSMWSSDARFSGMAMLLFNLDTERNIPTWFSTVLLAYLAIVAWDIVPRGAGKVTCVAYAALAGVFLFLSADESAQLHERFANLIEVDGTFAKARWVLLWLPVAGVVGMALALAMWRSSRRLVIGLAIGATIYLTGAVGVETINTYNRDVEARKLEAAGVGVGTTRKYDLSEDRYGAETWRYTLGTAAEEGLEMAGLITWCAVLLAARRRRVVDA